MQDFFRCDPEADEEVVARTQRAVCQKLVSDMLYEARKQAVMDYYAQFNCERVTKTQACTMQLTREEYMKVIRITIILYIHISFTFLHATYLLQCRWCQSGVMMTVGQSLWTSGSATPTPRSTIYNGNDVCLCQVLHTIRALAASWSINRDTYVTAGILYVFAQLLLSYLVVTFCRMQLILGRTSTLTKHMLWPTRARRRPPFSSTRRTPPRRTAIPPSTAASLRTQTWQSSSMGQSTTPAHTTSMERLL